MTEQPAVQQGTRVFDRVVALLDEHGAAYRVIEHEPEGRTEVVSGLRGNPLSQAAKCVVMRVKLTKKKSHYVLAVVPGDRRVDLGRVRELWSAVHVSFAERETAERLSGSVSGSIVPFSFDPALELVVDPDLLEQPRMFFTAGELDVSLSLDSRDYVRAASPRVERIAEVAA